MEKCFSEPVSLNFITKRSLNLNPLNFFLWEHLKSDVYETQPDDTARLTLRIKCFPISDQNFQNIGEEFESRFYYSLENIQHFE